MPVFGKKRSIFEGPFFTMRENVCAFTQIASNFLSGVLFSNDAGILVIFRPVFRSGEELIRTVLK
jgi:hypothetical protein